MCSVLSGSTLATTSGDTTVKIWNFAESGCTHTFTDHTSAGLGCFVAQFGSWLVIKGVWYIQMVENESALSTQQAVTGNTV